MTNNQFDLIVIGAGPGGYVAAIRAAQLGMSVACIDKRGTAGGTCLNIGCIPSKALLKSSEKFTEAQKELADHGVKTGEISLDLKTMISRKDAIVGSLTKGISFLFKKNKVEEIIGEARIVEAGKVSVQTEKEERIFETNKILIATGSESISLPGLDIDEEKIVTSTGALSLLKVPDHMVVVGAGYIGLEMASVWSRLGAKVTVVEFLDRITPSMDRETAETLHKSLQKQGIEFRLGAKVVEAQTSQTGVCLKIKHAAGGKTDEIDCNVVLQAIGRRPYTDGLGLKKLGITRDEKGFIQVDKKFETNVKGVFAIGDVIPGPMLAHKAEDEGTVAVEMMAGHSGHIDYNTIPAVIYTSPEVAAVGRTEEQLKEAGIAYSVGKFPFSANSRARSSGTESSGFVKILTDKATDTILGSHIVGHDAGTMIAELTLAMEFSASAEDLSRTCHAHPTLNEAVKEAALAAWGKPIHI